MARERPSRQSSVVKLCQYFGPHLDGHRYEAGICPILPNPLTIAMAAARLTGGRGILVLTHPRRSIPPRRRYIISDIERAEHTAKAHAHAEQGYIPSGSGRSYGKVGEWERGRGIHTLTCEGDDVTKHGEAITKGDVEVLLPSAVRMPGIRERENSSECPGRECEQQSDGGVEPEGLGDTRKVLSEG